jgi:hypothetical protein
LAGGSTTKNSLPSRKKVSKQPCVVCACDILLDRQARQ